MTCPILDTPLWRLVHAYRAVNAQPSGALDPMGNTLLEFGVHLTHMYAVLRGDKPASEKLIKAMADVFGISAKAVRRAADLTRAVRR